MKKKYNILVTGCGGDIGQSIGKILRSHPMCNAVIGTDIHDEHAGKFIFDKIIKVPNCRSDGYRAAVSKILETYSIDVIIPIAEPELRYFTDINLGSDYFGVPIIMANEQSRKIGFDKYETSKFLKEAGLPYPITHVVEEWTQPFFPIILKSRNGSGSKSVFIVNELDEFQFYAKRYPTFIAQELIGTDDQEYTCGLFRSGDGETRTVIYRRKLTGGFSGYGKLMDDVQIDQLLRTIAKKLDLRGSINVQLRQSQKGPVVFEINPRFSSTVMFRHLMGFEDVIWSIQDTFGLPLSSYLHSEIGTQFYKGFQEYVD